jgi:hypothetical protein
LENKIVTAIFKDSTHTKVSDVWQYDYGQILRIQGLNLPTAVEVDFAVAGSSESIARIGTTKDGVTDVVIPDSLIETGNNLVAYIYLRDAESGNTEYQIDMLVTKRAKPEAYDTPEDKELFGQAIEAVNAAADRAEKAGKTAQEAATKTGQDAEQTAQDRVEVAKMVETVTDISEQVKKVEDLSNKAQAAATKTEADAQQTAEDRVEVGKMLETVKDVSEQVKTVEESVRKAKESEQAAEGHRTAVEEMKNSVEQTASGITQVVQTGVQEINSAKQSAVQEVTQTGTAQKTAVEGAGTQAVENVENVKASATEAVETAKTEAVQSVQTEGNTQTGNVTTEGTKQVKAVQDKGNEVLQSIPEDFQMQMESKLDKQQGVENKGKALVIGEDGNVAPGEVQSGGGDGIAIINTMSGESPLVIPDSSNEKLQDIKLLGNSEQLTTTGKNLLEEKLSAFTITNDIAHIPLPEDHNEKQYTMLIQLKDGKKDTVGFSCGFYDKTDMPLAYKSPCLEGGKIVSSNGIVVSKKGANHHVCFTPASEDFFDIYHVIYTEGNLTSLPYEPYTGGKPSPSPEYPQEIKSVGRLNEDTGKYEIEISISGRNLFDFSTCEEGKIFEGSGNIVSAANGLLTDFIPCFPNSQYSRSRTGSTVVAFYDCDKNKIGFEIVGNTTFVTPEKCRYFRFSAVKTVVDYTKIVACPGQTVMDYEPYREPKFFTLASDRPITKWDKLVEQGGEIGWLYQSAINEYRGDTSVGIYQNGFCFLLNNKLKSGEGYCEELKQCVVGEKKPCISFNTAPNTYAYTLNTQAIYGSTTTAIKGYLKTHPLHLVYKTETTEFVPLPQSEQNAILALKTYYPTTVITVDGGELDPDIKVTYTADTKNYIDNKVSAKVASIIRQYRLNTANLLSLMPMETQATMIENDTNNILGDMEVQKHE